MTIHNTSFLKLLFYLKRITKSERRILLKAKIPLTFYLKH